MTTSNPLPTAAVVLTHEVADWGRWKAAFDADQGNRKAAGILGHHINRAQDNPNMVSIYLAVSDVNKAKAFATSPALHRGMTDAGVIGAPVVKWMTPVEENLVWDRELPAVMVSHTVADFDTWFAGYQAATAIRGAGGIIGHAANRSLENPNLMVVYHQAESFGALKAFTQSADLKAAMQKAGVTGAPTFNYVTGGWAGRY
jgi:hypothetical protein